MNLLQLRTKFRELSGRFDLVNDDYSDNGADFFINEGSKFLDRLVHTNKSYASCFRFINIGNVSAQIPSCRAIKEVWAMTSSSRWQLEKKPLQDLVSEYLSDLPSERNTGTPLYYAPTITRYIPEDATIADIESYIGWLDIPSGNAHNYNSILLNVPANEKLSVEVKGLFYSQSLTNDEDTNYWSSEHPLLLIMATMRQLEVINRNTQGVNDWTSAIFTDAKNIEFDLVEENISELTQMEG